MLEGQRVRHADAMGHVHNVRVPIPRQQGGGEGMPDARIDAPQQRIVRRNLEWLHRDFRFGRHEHAPRAQQRNTACAGVTFVWQVAVYDALPLFSRNVERVLNRHRDGRSVGRGLIQEPAHDIRNGELGGFCGSPELRIRKSLAMQLGASERSEFSYGECLDQQGATYSLVF